MIILNERKHVQVISVVIGLRIDHGQVRLQDTRNPTLVNDWYFVLQNLWSMKGKVDGIYTQNTNSLNTNRRITLQSMTFNS